MPIHPLKAIQKMCTSDTHLTASWLEIVVTPLVQDASGYGSSVSGASGPAAVTPLAGGTESTPDVAQTGLRWLGRWFVIAGEFKQLVGYQLLTRQGSAGFIA